MNICKISFTDQCDQECMHYTPNASGIAMPTSGTEKRNSQGLMAETSSATPLQTSTI
jgi:hypothetical protein